MAAEERLVHRHVLDADGAPVAFDEHHAIHEQHGIAVRQDALHLLNAQFGHAGQPPFELAPRLRFGQPADQLVIEVVARLAAYTLPTTNAPPASVTDEIENLVRTHSFV